MLDSETKRRIDSARDILVGKVPDPKSQVEQITIALIYKFMDDMDKQSIEMGGKASFFKGEFKKYGWGNIFDPRLGGVEMLNLYGEAITRMSQNANLPELFRNIFKNAYLPYRDPETLKLFLKTINDFTYDHSEKLGDAFEYLLSVLGSQGDAGQFRTPRHIIDFMVQVVDPQKNETVLDPACGTAGFLISAYKHIVNNNQDPKGLGKPLGSLSAQEKQKIYENFTGYDISPDMVRLSLVNLYLHGFVKPQIHEYDSLASEERWNEYADVILANPPFMSPKGGIMPHKKFSVQSNRSEVLFVDYMAEHLTPNGRAAIIVPEGIIFQSAGAYKQLRKYLIEHNFLWAVVSLPAGAFNPYSGVKTSILFLDKSLAKKTDRVLFVKVENDDFDLGAQRHPNDRNDLPQTVKVLKSFRASILDGKAASFSPKTDSALLVSISKLAETGDYNLSADRYREVIRVGKQKYPNVLLGDICENLDSQRKPVTKSDRTQGKYPYYGASGIVDYVEEYIFDGKYLLVSEDGANLLARSTPIAFSVEGKVWVNNHAHILKFSESVTQTFIELYLNSIDLSNYVTGAAQPKLTQASLNRIPIPLPPLEIQRQLVDEIAAHQRIIDGARQVVEGWSPKIDVNPDWEITTLESLCSIKHGFAFKGNDFSKSLTKNLPIVLTPGNFAETGGLYFNERNTKRFSGKVDKEYLFNKGDLVVVMTDLSSKMKILGNPAIIESDNILHNQRIGKVILHSKKVITEYLHYAIFMPEVKKRIQQTATGTLIKHTSPTRILECSIPLPPLEIQREIIARIETERAIVHGNRELIRLYEKKVKKVIERVWEG